MRSKPLKKINDTEIEKCNDYSLGIDGLPKSDVLKYFLKDGSTIIVRPSGTEPKLKMYISLLTDDDEAVDRICEQLLGQ